MRLSLQSIEAGYAGRTILHDVTFDLVPGAMTGIVGPNGCGKSTMLKVLTGRLVPSAGKVSLDDRPLRAWPQRQLARHLACLPQAPVAPPGITVRDLVTMGRHPHLSWHQRLRPKDRSVVDKAIERCDLLSLAGRHVHTLSGGERQRAWIAMTIAQEPHILLLDEPTSSLDINHALEVLDLLRDLNRATGLTIGLVMHDINLALRHCDRIAAMATGRILRHGPVDKALVPETIRQIFGVEAREVHVGPHRLLDFHRISAPP